MTDSLRDRIAAVIYTEFRRQFDGEGIDTPLVAPAVGSDEFGGVALIDGEVNLIAVADAVIAALGLQPHLAKRIINGKPDQWVRRHVTDWEIVDV